MAHGEHAAHLAASLAPAWFTEATARVGESRYLDVSGNRIHYLCWGMERADKPALIFIHGYRAHARWWAFIAPFFATRFRVVAIDLVGMGDSSDRLGADYSALNFALDVIAVVLHERLDPVTAIGHSVGGVRAVRAAGERPELFAELIVIDSNYPLPGMDVAKWRSLPIRKRSYPDSATALSRFRLTPHDADLPPYIHDYIARHSMKRTEAGWTWKWDARLPTGTVERDVAEVLGRVEAPVTYLYGEKSSIVSADTAHRIVSMFKRGRGPIAIPAAHHHVPLDQPLALVAALRVLLARVHQ